MKYFTETEIEFLKQNYLEMTSREMGERLGRNEKSIQQKLFKLGLKRPARLVRPNTIKSQFKPGLVPWNKDLKGIHVSPDTEFKPGHLPVNTKYDGAIMIRRHQRSGKSYKFIRIAAGKWVTYHSYIWEQAHGPIQDGWLVRFKKGCDTLDVCLANLELVSRAKHLRMNANYKKFSQSMKQYWRNGGEGHLNSDRYVAFTLAARDRDLRIESLNHPEIIELKRMELKLKRVIKNESGKQSGGVEGSDVSDQCQTAKGAEL